MINHFGRTVFVNKLTEMNYGRQSIVGIFIIKIKLNNIKKIPYILNN